MPDKTPAPTDKTKAEFSLFQLLPNMLTIAAICAGISAIRFGAEGKFPLAVSLIALASILDGMDGRAARYLGPRIRPPDDPPCYNPCHIRVGRGE